MRARYIISRPFGRHSHYLSLLLSSDDGAHEAGTNSFTRAEYVVSPTVYAGSPRSGVESVHKCLRYVASKAKPEHYGSAIRAVWSFQMISTLLTVGLAAQFGAAVRCVSDEDIRLPIQ